MSNSLSEFICTEAKGNEFTGAEEDDCIPLIVPVQVLAKMGCDGADICLFRPR